MTGNDYEALPPAGRQLYLTGIMDGFLYAPMWSTDGSRDHARTDALNKCNAVVGMSSLQLTKVVDSFMDKHPSYWGAAMNGNTASALEDFCRGVGHKLY